MTTRTTKRPSFLSGVSVLTLSAVVVKVIGLLYRIPMLDRLGTEGMGYFNTAYELYALFCALSTAGLPVAITISLSSLRLMSIESVMPSSHLILCHPLLLLPPIPPSISLFQ